MTTANILLPNGASASTDKLAQQIYDHLLHHAKTELPEQVLHRFQLLFIQGGAYPEPEIRAALHNLVRSTKDKHGFFPFFNRCCFIIVNRWQMQILYRENIIQFVEVIKQCRAPSVMTSQPTPSGKLRFWIQEYTRSPLFQKLQQLADFLNPKTELDERKPLSSLLYRYPSLYTHCLSSQEDSDEYQGLIQQTQKTAQQRFEQDLSRYVTYSLMKPGVQQQQNQSALILPDNPTLLTHDELCQTLQHFVSKVDRRASYRERAEEFWLPGHRPTSYATFKSSLYDYLLEGIPTKFGESRFNNQLSAFLKDLHPESNAQPVNDFLLVRTCNQILNFLVIESRQHPKHIVFMNLLNNLGSTQTMGLLLRVVLLCRKVKPYLDRRFALMFQHYQGEVRSNVKWLVKCLEKLNLAWCSHFSNQSLSFVQLL
jgi:hypothetical protein